MNWVRPRETATTPEGPSEVFGDRRLLWLAAAIWSGFILMEMLIDPASWMMATIWAAAGFVLMIGFKLILDRAPSAGIGRVVTFAGLTIIVALMQTTLDVVMTDALGPLFLGQLAAPAPGTLVSPVGIPFELKFKVSLRSYLWIYGLYAAAVALSAAARNEFRAREDSFAARLQTQKAELDALRLQVNPHFLFNGLNGLASLARSGKSGETERMALGLARYYRGFVGVDQEVIPLSEEMEAVEAYLEVERHRLRKLTFVLDCPDDLQAAQVPSMILQPIVENAVKYGVAGDGDPAPIRLTARRVEDRLQITCESGVSPNPDASGAGSGLRTIHRRLEKTFGDQATLVLKHGAKSWRSVLNMPLTGV